MKINTLSNRRAFTFLEIMLVVMIIGLLAAVVGPRIVGQGQKARIKTTKLQLGSLEAGLKLYTLDVGNFPTTQQGLEALLKRPSDVDEDVWDGPYIDGSELPVDAWRHAYHYEFPSTHEGVEIALWSDGPDGVENNDDDIVNWPKK